MCKCCNSSSNILVIPDLEQVVTTASDKSALLARPRVGADQATGGSCGSPANGVDSHSMSMEDLMGPAVVLELEDADMAVGRSTAKEAPALVRRPRDHVHGGSVKGEIENLGPGTTGGRRRRVLVLFAPDEHLSIVRGGGEDRSKLGVGLQLQRIMLVDTTLRNPVRNSGLNQETHTQATHQTAPSCLQLFVPGQRLVERFQPTKSLTLSRSLPSDVPLPRFRKPLSSCPTSMSPICGRSSPGRHRAAGD